MFLLKMATILKMAVILKFCAANVFLQNYMT